MNVEKLTAEREVVFDREQTLSEAERQARLDADALRHVHPERSEKLSRLAAYLRSLRLAMVGGAL